MILVANKVDLSTRRRVSEEEGMRMAQKLNVPYLETSAKDPPVNIDEAFREVRISLLASQKYERLFVNRRFA